MKRSAVLTFLPACTAFDQPWQMQEMIGRRGTRVPCSNQNGGVDWVKVHCVSSLTIQDLYGEIQP